MRRERVHNGLRPFGMQQVVVADAHGERQEGKREVVFRGPCPEGEFIAGLTENGVDLFNLPLHGVREFGDSVRCVFDV